MANRLAAETSPYLLQHKDNPVDWYAWGEEALGRAKTEDKPIMVSIGYSACHWCHVMEHESFEDPETAAYMNDHLISVKVDREERPDVDAIYMQAVQAMTGHGGWPLNVFADPDGVPFFGGTYFPPTGRQGMPSFRQVLEGVVEAWNTKREEIRTAAPRTVERLAAISRVGPTEETLSPEALEEAERTLASQFDPVHGGFGAAPKFPPASALEFLMMRGSDNALSIVTTTLERMAKGGIFDQVGGGFARYSVDAQWLVPHFEKMLYDNALLARAYLHAWQLSGEERFRRVCRETLDWALRELRGPEGGFCSALDADSEGVEGKFYVWTVAELRDALGPSLADQAIAYFGVTERGNFEHGTNVLTARGDEPDALDETRAKLLEVRSKRVRPGLDDKRLTAWNALMVSALAEAGAVLSERTYLDAATACASFILSELRDGEGRLLRSWKDGRAHLGAYLEDHAFLLDGLITLYESTFEPRWYREAVALADALIESFEDPERGGFYTTPADRRELPVRRKDLEDSPIPSGNSAAALALLRLALLSGDGKYERHALGVLRLMFGLAARHPLAFGHLLRAADFHVAPVREVAIIGPETEVAALLRVVRSRFRPHMVLAGGDGDGVPLLQGRETVDGHAAAYVCEHFVCQAPVTTAEALAAAL
jgi:uncharacterized protein YyaL (SSP411 family)